MDDLTLGLLLVLTVLAVAGTIVQGVIGFGLGVVASPIIAWLRPDLLPAAILVAATTIPVLTLRREWRHVDFRALAWILAGRLPATALGVAIVVVVPVNVLQLIVAAAVLVAVAASAGRWRIPRTPATLAGAGFLSGITGTTSGIGGPPPAIVLQDDDPAVVRATLAVLFLVGSLISVGSLAAAGVVRTAAVLAGLAMIPGVLVGFAAAVPLRRHLDAVRFRRAVLALSVVSAVALVVKAL